MEEWWKKHGSYLPVMDNLQKNQIEDITGKIPLFLNVLLESVEFGCKNFEEAWGFLNNHLESKIKEPMTNFSKNIPKEKQDLYVFFGLFRDW
jgi:hypothetical protein